MSLRLVQRTFTSKVQLRQAKGTGTGTLARPLATVQSITGAEPPSGPSSLLRSASFNGITHTVVPIVALVGDIVLQAANAPAPELVPLYCLESLPLSAWNGRPILPLHPSDGQDYVSANSPDVLDKYGFGLTFNAALSSGALQLDGYLNPVRALAVGPLANDVLARLATDTMIEVSVGVSVLVSDEVGTIKSLSGEDVSYSAVWQQLLYIDHVAMLPAGVEGACSVVSGGCGAPRISSQGNVPIDNNNVTIAGGGSIMAEVTAEGAQTQVATPVAVSMDSSVTSPGEIFYGNMRDRLRAALYDLLTAQVTAQVPAPGESAEGEVEDLYIWVVDWSNKSVIYEKGPDYQRYKRSYSLDSVGKVILADDELEVNTEQVYKPASGLSGLMGKIKSVIAQAVFGEEGRDTLRSLAGARHSSKDQTMIQTIHDHAKDLGAGCATDSEDEPATLPTMINAEAAPQDSHAAPCSCKGGSKVAMTKEAKTALVAKILSAQGSVFKEDQRAALEATDEKVLEVLASATIVDPDADKPKEVTPVQVVAQVATPAAPLTPEQWWAQAPPEMAGVRALAASAAESAKQEKDTLVRALTTAQEAFTEPQLTAMDLTGLRSLASLTGLFLPRFDYTGAAGTLTRDAASTTQDKETAVYHNPPRPFDLIRAAKSGGKSTAASTSTTSTTPGAN